MNYHNMADELYNAGKLEGSEVGEWWIALSNLLPRVFDCASEEFLEIFKLEITNEYNRLKEEFTIEESSITQTVVTKRLVHYSETTPEWSLLDAWKKHGPRLKVQLRNDDSAIVNTKKTTENDICYFHGTYSLNIDGRYYLATVDHPFDIIGLTE